MHQIKRIIYIFLVMTLACNILLTACTTYTHPPHSPYLIKQTVVRTGYGALAGAWAGGITGTSIAAGAGIGAIVGAASASEHEQLKLLQKAGIQVIQVGDTVRIIVPSDEIFPINSAHIIPASYPALDFLISYIRRYGRTPIDVDGYTDNIGAPKINHMISEHQAQSILGYLWTHGIPFQDIRATGFGENNPIANNADPVGNAFNRRIEISFPVIYDQHHQKLT